MTMRQKREGTIFQRKETGRWVAAVSLPNGRRRTRYAPDPDTALLYLEELRKGVASPSPRVSLSAYLDAWLMGMRAQVAPRTWSRWAGIVKNWIEPGLGKTTLRDLSVTQVRSWLHSLPLHPQTVVHVRATLRRALADAVVDGMIPRNVAALAKPPMVPRDERRWLTGDELRALFDATIGTPRHALWVLAGTTGLRSGELLALSWGDVDLDSGYLHVRHTLHRLDDAWVLRPTKTRQTRRVPLSAYTIRALTAHHGWYDQHAAAQGFAQQHGLVFVSARGLPLHGPNLSKALKADLRAAKLPGVTVHALRHSAASWWLSLGVDIPIIAKLLGHSDPRITMTLYAHVAEEAKGEAVARMQEALGG